MAFFSFLLYFALFVGIQLATGRANECYECAISGCDDKFDPNAAGVSKQPSDNGWCYVRNNILLIEVQMSIHQLPFIFTENQG